MKITSINNTSNTNFNGKFIYSPTVRRILNQSETSSIKNFEKLLEKSEKVNDSLVFKLEEKNKVRMVADNIIKVKEYILKIFNEKTSNEDSFTIVDSCDIYASQELIDADNKKILGILTNFIEDTYYSSKENKEEEKDNIQQKTKDEIIKTLDENKG